MKVSDMINKNIEEMIKEMKLIDIKIHNDDDGIIRSIELKYIPDDEQANIISNLERASKKYI